MAITRSQIARQLLAEGGAPNPRKPFQMGGFGDTGLATETMSDFSTDVGGTADPSSFGDTGDLGSEQANVAANLSAMKTSGVGQGADLPGVIGFINKGLTNFRNRTNLNRRTSFLNKIGYGNQFNPEFIQSPLGLQTLKNMGYTTIEDVIATQRGEGESKIIKPMVPKLPTDIEPEKSDMAEAEFVQRFTLPERFELSNGGGITGTKAAMQEARQAYDRYKRSGGTLSFDKFIALGNEGVSKFFANGGEVRQAYGLGSIVKKVTGAVKKVAKSDIGKAALIAGTGYYLGGGSMGPFAKFLPTMKYGNAAGTGFGFGNILPNVLSSFGATGLADKAFTMGTAGKIATGIGATALAAGFLTPKEEEEADSLSKKIADNTGIDVEQIRKEVQEAYASGNTKALRTKYPFLPPETAVAADGGRIGFENGGSYSFEQFKKDKFKVDQFMGEEQMRKMYEDMMRKKRVAEQRSMAVDGGDIDEAPKEDMPKQEMASAVGDETDDISMQLFGKGVKDLTPDEFRELMDEIDRLQNKFRSEKDSGQGIMMMASDDTNERVLQNLYESYLDLGFSPEDAAKKAKEEFDRMGMKQGIERTMAAGGGMMNPNDEMLNLGGNEMDLRGGGFVPLGEYEKKDDVPARLSKNEFVFTADAVRAAGGGSVDRGADLMYKTMKQLENKVV